MKRFGHAFIWMTIGLVFICSIATILFHPDYGGKFSGQSGDLELIATGKKVFAQKKCYACHGSDGKDPITETFPIIAGQTSSYLEAQIRDITSGYRTNGMSSQMKSAVGPLTDEEIRALSHYLSHAK